MSIPPDRPDQQKPVSQPQPEASPDASPHERERTLEPARPPDLLERPERPPEAAPEVPRRGDWGRLVAGAVLIVGGIAWLLDAADAVDIHWRLVFPAALIAVGAAIAVGARRGAHGGLIAVGVALTIVVASSSFVPLRVGVGIGDRTERPAAAADVADGYGLAVGSLTIDLRDVELAGDTRVEASVGVGELIVFVPADRPLEVEATVGAGEASALDRTEQGVGVELSETFPAEGSDGPPLILELSVGLGEIQVRR